MDQQGAPHATSLIDRRSAVSEVMTLLRDLDGVLYQCPSDDLGVLAGELAALRARCGAALVDTVVEAQSRGVIGASQHASAAGWVAANAWHSRREASTVAKAAAIVVRDELSPVADAIADTDIDLPTATVIGAEYDKIAPDLTGDAQPMIVEQFIAIGATHGPSGVRQLKELLLARYGRDGEFEKHQERCRRQIDLSAGRSSAAGVWEYRLTLDNEGRAVLEAAIGPLSAPKPDPHDGAPDTRSAGRRRGEALVAALRRAGATGAASPAPKTTVMVTMRYDDLAAHVGAAEVLGSLAGPTGIAGTAAVFHGPCDTDPSCPTHPGQTGGTRATDDGNGGLDGVHHGLFSAVDGHSVAACTQLIAVGDDRTWDGPPPVTDSRQRAADGECRWHDGDQPPADRAGVWSEGPPPRSLGDGGAPGCLPGGLLLAADTVRKLACDAEIIPAVLGGDGAVLSQGYSVRLFTANQVRALWARDRHCTFPQCDVPAAWCDAHHLRHWVDGGPTDLDNAALLCPRHHTVVHRDRLAGALTGHGVQWDRNPGSYRVRAVPFGPR